MLTPANVEFLQAGEPAYAVVEVNDRRKKVMAERIVAACGGSVAGKTVAVLGLTFKPNTDDMRDSPALDIVPALIAAGATVRAYDPEGMDSAKRELPDVVWCEDVYDAMDGADALPIARVGHVHASADDIVAACTEFPKRPLHDLEAEARLTRRVRRAVAVGPDRSRACHEDSVPRSKCATEAKGLFVG